MGLGPAGPATLAVYTPFTPGMPRNEVMVPVVREEGPPAPGRRGSVRERRWGWVRVGEHGLYWLFLQTPM